MNAQAQVGQDSKTQIAELMAKVQQLTQGNNADAAADKPLMLAQITPES